VSPVRTTALPGSLLSESRRPAVAVAIVTCDRGILVGQRRDGNPPWTFPGGKIEPGESPEGAAVREALEETGLRVRATGVIGSRPFR
jgi:8-oxo-dGTP diphosphatase